ncbi:LuxR C-terminal-related transcriptional regulator [Lentilactobacillus hilgardii]|uniref:GAF domain-containing protein n=1 Tax=Lentilactobacillus hilgardii TaxID=1588 RepID=A0A6P1E5W4_LENHI|nr:LuxR C-terminal-related transcriptional regulator [Lentilactobacillus hilgardii]EEI70757.1 transcriptional regulator, LuxR family [Lentilactobacillus hilgardii ATCC 27305]MCT3390554.1 GAF domain-containing protein [Lentilactobacillus hilgardii]QHB52806.1 GAF domain-containing protein [Lentilactobacillus hilgardii]RRG12646.1 MAG: LuxR family transcriptional regulator [Lactobacillus sp.]
MKTFSTNDLYVLNNIVHHIYCCKNPNQMREQLISQLSFLLDFDGSTFYLASPQNDQQLTSPVVVNIDPVFGQKYLACYDQLDYSKGLMFTGRSMTYRESDIIPDTQRIHSKYYQIFYAKYGFHYSLHSSIAFQGHFLGILSFFRTKGKPNFTQNDIELIGLLTNHLEARLFNDYQAACSCKNKLTLHDAALRYGLTKRQQVITRSLLDGMDNDEICAQLYITNNTLKKHILNVYRKLGINNRVQLFKMVREKE